MKIGFDAKRAFYNTRGLGNYSRDTIRILSEKQSENEFYLFTPKIRDSIPFQYGRNTQIIQPEGVLFKKNPSLWRTFFMSNDINRLNLDIYHGLSHELPVGIEKTSTRSVVTMHDVIFLKFPELYTWIDRRLYKKKYLQSCQIADKIIAISEQTKNDLIEFANIDEKKINVVYQGCNPIFLKEVHAEKLKLIQNKYQLPKEYLLNVGAIEKRKNQELIIQALAHGRIDIPLIIVGKPTDYFLELKKLVKELHVESKVIFLTNVPTEDLPAIYQLSSLFVYPSIFEGFGIPILEAIHSKIPVITSKGSCFEETGGAESCYVNHKSVEELIAAIESILGHTEKRKKMIEAGTVHAKNFSDDCISTNIMKVYQSIL